MKFVLLVMMISLASCGAVQYQKADSNDAFSVGYYDTKIKANTYRVKFQGNGNNSPDNVYMNFLKRGAELARDNNFKFFLVKNDQAGALQNGPVFWPYHQGNIELTNTNDKDAFVATEILSQK